MLVYIYNIYTYICVQTYLGIVLNCFGFGFVSDFLEKNGGLLWVAFGEEGFACFANVCKSYNVKQIVGV